MKWLEFAASVPLRLFPHRCALCDGPAEGMDLCAGCLADLPTVGPSCTACAAELPATTGLCGRCVRHPPPMGLTLAPLRYELPVDWLITRLKFHGTLWHGPLLARLIVRRAAPLLPPGGVVLPVPLHRRREARRGYNQALEIARPLARLLGRDLETGLLRRHRRTREQSRLSARERRRNVAGAFRLRRPPAFRHAIVVDDVITTGATVAEVAGLLVGAGCRQVTVLAAARALRGAHQAKT